MNDALNTPEDPVRMSLPQRSRHACMTLVLSMIASASCVPALATQLVPSRNAAAPGESVRVAVNPPLNATMPAGARLFFAQEGRRGLRTELRLAEWKGDSFVAVLPCNAQYNDAGVLQLTREVQDVRGGPVTAVLATSARHDVRTPLFQIRTGKGASCAERLQPRYRAQSATRETTGDHMSRRPASGEFSPAATPKLGSKTATMAGGTDR